MKIKQIILSFLMFGFLLSSCQDDFLETAPTDALSSDVMFESYAGAQLALNGTIRKFYAFDGDGLGHHGAGYLGQILDIELMGEDMARWDRGYGWYSATYGWLSHRIADGTVTTGRWEFFYDLINQANTILFYADLIDDATTSQINNLKAQALVIRSISYYWLVMKHAQPYYMGRDNPGIPVYTEPTQDGNPRASIGEVYDRITTDLNDAVSLFNATDDPAYQQHKSHINLATAYGVAARTALAMQDYGNATTFSQNAIDASTQSLYSVGDFSSDPHTLFNTVGSEWIWGVQLTDEHAPGYASFGSHMDPRFMSYAALGGQVLLNEELYEAMSPSDVRRALWVAPEDTIGFGPRHSRYMAYNNNKLLVKQTGLWGMDVPFMRLAEMYLIKAEALARGTGSDADAAQTLYELVSNRDPDYTLSTNTGDDLVEEIMFHRRIELWGEGFRFFDLKRTGTDLMRTADQGHNMGLANEHHVVAGDPKWQWMIPQDEIDANDQISSGDQNP